MKVEYKSKMLSSFPKPNGRISSYRIKPNGK